MDTGLDTISGTVPAIPYRQEVHMILDVGPARRISQTQARILETGNIMAQRAWKLYKFTHDEKHSEGAEYWRMVTGQAIERERKS